MLHVHSAYQPMTTADNMDWVGAHTESERERARNRIKMWKVIKMNFMNRTEIAARRRMDNNGQRTKKGARIAHRTTVHVVSLGTWLWLYLAGVRWIYALVFNSPCAALLLRPTAWRSPHMKAGVHHRVSFETRPKYSDKFNHIFWLWWS